MVQRVWALLGNHYLFVTTVISGFILLFVFTYFILRQSLSLQPWLSWMGILIINGSHTEFLSEELRSICKSHHDILMGTFLQGEVSKNLTSPHKTLANSVCNIYGRKQRKSLVTFCEGATKEEREDTSMEGGRSDLALPHSLTSCGISGRVNPSEHIFLLVKKTLALDD